LRQRGENVVNGIPRIGTMFIP